MFNECIDFLKRAVVKQQFDALTGRELTTVVLSLHPGLSATRFAAGLSVSQVLEAVLCARHGVPRASFLARRPYALLSTFLLNDDNRRHSTPAKGVVDRVETCAGTMDHPLRIVVAKPGLDGHDRGAKVVARALRDAGHEVIYTGLRRTSQQIVETVRDEDARFLGLSSLSGAHAHLFPQVCKKLVEEGLHDVVVFGGGIIPEDDRPALHEAGIRAIFGPGTPTSEILDFINTAHNKDDVGVGQSGTWSWESSA